MHHLVSAQYWNRPASGNTGHIFLTFGGISNCPLATVCIYLKVLIIGVNCRYFLMDKQVAYFPYAPYRIIGGVPYFAYNGIQYFLSPHTHTSLCVYI